MTISRIPSLFLHFILITYSTSLEKSNAFRTKLYHRDFPGSPLISDPTLSLTERVRRAVDRSIAYHTRSASVTPKATVAYNYHDYMMKISLGAPPVEYFLSMDTASELTWVECAPCEICLARNATRFDPSKSTAYRQVRCNGQDPALCPDMLDPLGTKACSNNVCTYAYTYTFGTKTSGDIGTDILTLDSTMGLPQVQANFTFGCAYNNEGFLSEKATGMFGLGTYVPGSFMNQLHEHTKGKFSYCLVSVLSGSEGLSTINFGDDAIPTQLGVVKTPLHLRSDDNGPGYYASLEAVTIAGERIEFSPPESGRTASEIMINAGTTLSRFPTRFYIAFMDAIKRHVNAQPVPDPSMKFTLCYYNDYFGLEIPDVIAHFVGGAEIYLDRDNLFVRSTDEVMCLAISEDFDGSQPVWGNVFQTNFHVGFDTEAGTLSFMPTMSCSNVN